VIIALEIFLVLLMLKAAFIGVLSICWAKADHRQRVCRVGKCLFVITLVALGVTGSVAAFLRSEGLAPLGLLAGFLVVGMLWDSPTSTSLPSEFHDH
jgi:hypothetical protein